MLQSLLTLPDREANRFSHLQTLLRDCQAPLGSNIIEQLKIKSTHDTHMRIAF